MTADCSPGEVPSENRKASLIAASADDGVPSLAAKRNSRFAVVTIFSISELERVSRIGIVFIKMVEFGISSVAACNSASAARARMHALSTADVSSSSVGGRAGRALNGTSGRKRGRPMSMRSHHNADVSTKSIHVDKLMERAERVDRPKAEVDHRLAILNRPLVGFGMP
jgi:hypothetical protein